jgi:NAD(P)-dependent dehydrogenase (short-subunit alcohol dehydrogenase family)
MSRLAGEVAIITGGGSGIGRGIALTLAAERARVVVADLDVERAEGVASEIIGSGGAALALRADVTASADVAAMVAATTAEFGAATILVNNAGTCRLQRFLETTEKDAEALWRVHALASFLCSQAVLPAMLESRFGRILMITSGVGGYGASAWTTLYQSAKSAQTTLARGMALAFGASGVTVNCISPGLVETPLWDGMDDDYVRVHNRTAREEIELRSPNAPVGRAITPEEVGLIVAFLALRDSSALNGVVIDM